VITLIACLVPETQVTATLTRASLATLPQRDLPIRTVTVDGVAGERADGRISGREYAGSIKIPTRDVGVVVRTTDLGLTTRILDSFRLVDVDHIGCAAFADWRKALPDAQAAALALPVHTARLSICDYRDARLAASAELTGPAADTLVGILGAAAPGPNQDATERGCVTAASPPTQPDLILRPEGGVPLAVFFSACQGRGITDGDHTVRITDALLSTLMTPLHTGWTVAAPLE